MDREVKQKQILISNELADALQKGQVDTKATIPKFLTPEKLLEIDRKSKDVVLNLASKAIQELIEEGHEVSFEDPMFGEKLKKVDFDGPMLEI
mgnify:CR=1 FL=1